MTKVQKRSTSIKNCFTSIKTSRENTAVRTADTADRVDTLPSREVSGIMGIGLKFDFTAVPGNDAELEMWLITLNNVWISNGTRDHDILPILNEDSKKDIVSHIRYFAIDRPRKEGIQITHKDMSDNTMYGGHVEMINGCISNMLSVVGTTELYASHCEYLERKHSSSSQNQKA